MGIPKLWEVIAAAAETRSLLNLATTEGFQANNRGFRTLIIGVDISIRINAIVAALQAANAFNPGPGGQTLVLEKLFYQLCNFLLAPLTMVFIFDGPGRPPVKRGTRVIYRPPWLIQHLKAMITAFGFYFYDAPGEAEAELAQLNKNGEIDGIITEDSDAFLFGAQCVIRTLGPSVQHESSIFTSESIENTDSVSLDQDGLLLCGLLLGGDYDDGIAGAGVTVAHALAAQGLGKELVNVLKSCAGIELDRRLVIWRNKLQAELRTNLSGRLGRCYRKLADSIPDTFPDVQVANLYLNPLTSRSPGFAGQTPNAQLWRPHDPSIPQLSMFCSTLFGWNGEQLLKKLNSNLWPGVTFKLFSSPYVIYQPGSKLLASPSTKANILKSFQVTKYKPAFGDSAELELYRVRVSTDNFIQLASLHNLPRTAQNNIKLVSIPKVVLAVATRDLSFPTTDITRISIQTQSGSKAKASLDSEEGGESSGGSVVDVMDSDEEDLAKAHYMLTREGVIDLTGDS